MILEMQLKVIHATSVEKLGTSLESVLCSTMKTSNIKNQEVTKRIEGTCYSAREIEKLLQIWWSKRLLLHGVILQVIQKTLMNQKMCLWWLYMRRKPCSVKCLLIWTIQKMNKRTTM